MKEKLKSRKFWMAILSNIISLIAIFSDIGGPTGTILGIIGTVLSSISYMLMEGMIDKEKVKIDYIEIKNLIETLKKEGE